MDKLDKLLSSLPKAKLSGQADRRIKYKLYRLIFLSKLEKLLAFSNYKAVFSNKGLAFALTIISIFSATSFYAYASDNVIPGNQLYPLKIAIEKLEKKIAINAPAKIATYEKLSNRRLQEAVNLSQINLKAGKTSDKIINENIEKNITAEIDNHETVVYSINNLSDPTKVEAAIYKAKKNDQSELNSLDKIAEYAQSVKDEKLLETVNKAKEIISHQKYDYDQKDEQPTFNNLNIKSNQTPEKSVDNEPTNNNSDNENLMNPDKSTTKQNNSTDKSDDNKKSDNQRSDKNNHSNSERN